MIIKYTNITRFDNVYIMILIFWKIVLIFKNISLIIEYVLLNNFT